MCLRSQAPVHPKGSRPVAVSGTLHRGLVTVVQTDFPWEQAPRNAEPKSSSHLNSFEEFD